MNREPMAHPAPDPAQPPDVDLRTHLTIVGGLVALFVVLAVVAQALNPVVVR